MFYAATLVMHAVGEFPAERFWFASLDGRTWLGVSGDPRLADPTQAMAELQEAFDPPPSRGRKFLPMTMDRRFLSQRQATFFDVVV